MTSVEQHHYGEGDNVAGNKIIQVVKSVAPADLVGPIEMVFESLRQKDKKKAKAEINLLKLVARQNLESLALLEVISIYAGLVEDQDQDQDQAWAITARIISRTANPIIRDVCLAALLKLSVNTAREGEAVKLYLSEVAQGPNSVEAYLRYYADEARLQLEAANSNFPIEGVLTGAAEGAFRLNAVSLMLELTSRLNSLYGSYNSRVLLAVATGIALNPDLAKHHFWLNRAEVKEKVDKLRDMAISLLDESGTDGRVHDLCCSILDIYQYESAELSEALKRHIRHLDATRSELVARCKALIGGGDAHLSQTQKDLQAAYKDPQRREAWCRQFLDASTHKAEEVDPFINLANPSELREWLGREQILAESSEIEEAYVRFAAGIFLRSGQKSNPSHRYELSEYVNLFITKWDGLLSTFATSGLFKIAEKLFSLQLPHLALKLTKCVMPNHDLWPSPYVLSYLQFLQAARQNRTFEEFIARVKGADKSLMLLSLKSVQAERRSNIGLAIELSDLMIDLSPTEPYVWQRRCYLLFRYSTLEEQQLFHERIPDSLLQIPSADVKQILFFLAVAGSFKRAESLWVKWMIENPQVHAVDLVNFYFSLIIRKKEPIQYSPSVGGCLMAVQFCHESSTLVRLIVDDELEGSECTLKASSQAGQLLQKLSPGDSEDINMVTYQLEQRLPPYVACVQIASELRQIRNDGSDCFAMLKIPSDPGELIPFLEKKFAQGEQTHEEHQAQNAVSLYVRGHLLHPSDAFKASINCWTDQRIPKSALCNIGDVQPAAVVLDAYSIGYLAVTNCVRHLLNIGVSFILPEATREKLDAFLTEISDEKFMTLGLTDGGRLARTTASDIRERNAHVLENLRLILEKTVVVRLAMHDEELDIFSIKDGVDATVYAAMQLSVANKIPWFCMDEMFGGLHHAKGHPLVNTQALLLRAMADAPFDFEKRRHALVLFALDALPMPLTFQDLYRLADTLSTLAGFIIFKVIENHGRNIFAGEERAEILLQVIYTHLERMFGKEAQAVIREFNPWMTFTSHVFNHGLNLYLSLNAAGSAEFRLAIAMHHMTKWSIDNPSFMNSLIGRFRSYARGHFMSFDEIVKELTSIVEGRQLQASYVDDKKT